MKACECAGVKSTNPHPKKCEGGRGRLLSALRLLAVSLGIAHLWLHPTLEWHVPVALTILLLWPSLAVPAPLPWPQWRQAWNAVLLLAAIASAAIFLSGRDLAWQALIATALLAELRWAYNPGDRHMTSKMIGLALLLVVATAEVSVSPWFAVLLSLFLVTSLAALLWSEIAAGIQVSIANSQPSVGAMPKRILAVWMPPLRLATVCAALAIMIFLGVPRERWESTAPQQDLELERRVALTGMSSEITLGAYELLLDDPTPAVHVTWLDEAPRDPIYLRGCALGRLESVEGMWRWSRIPAQPTTLTAAPNETLPLIEGDLPPNLVGQQIELLDSSLRSVFALPWVVSVRGPGGAIIGEGGWRWRAPNLTERWPVYEAWSSADRRVNPSQLGEPQPDHLYLPDDLRTRVVRFLETRQITTQADIPTQRISSIIHHLRANHQHTLDMRGMRGGDPLEAFLFHPRDGNCEMFASAMTVMCRAVGIPAQMVTGFHGGEVTEDGGRLFRRSDAHAWVEVWLAGEGWVMMDPTPPAPLVTTSNLGLWRQVTGIVGGISGQWRQHVVQYEATWHQSLFRWGTNRADQLTALVSGEPGLLKRSTAKITSNLSERPSLWTLIAGIALLNIAALWLDRRIRRHGWPWMKRSPSDNPQEALVFHLARIAAPRPRRRGESETVAEYLRSLVPEGKSTDDRINRIIALYYAWRYGAEAGQRPARELIAQARSLSTR